MCTWSGVPRHADVYPPGPYALVVSSLVLVGLSSDTAGRATCTTDTTVAHSNHTVGSAGTAAHPVWLESYPCTGRSSTVYASVPYA